MSALAKLHIAKKQLGLDDDTWRDLLERETGKRSSKDMSNGERGRVLDVLKNHGFKAASRGSRKDIEGKYAPKLQALWIAGYNLGLIRNRDDAALLAFVKRQTGIDHTRFLRYAEDGARAIEALKGWLDREGGVDWSKDRFLPDWTQANGYRIAKAQHAKLCRLEADTAQPLSQWLGLAGFTSPALMTDSSWIAAMNRLGALIRAADRGGA
ncbi:regulatory protein GemA [Hoeflea alexandrii]|uniref:regulatory protein GemA n=1 Tax=Hoeflea alexandrii TaxID=288436 RepID=UPI0035CEA35B